MPAPGPLTECRDVILDEGCLARRILRAAGDAPSRERLREVYGALGACLDKGEMFRGAPAP